MGRVHIQFFKLITQGMNTGAQRRRVTKHPGLPGTEGFSLLKRGQSPVNWGDW